MGPDFEHKLVVTLVGTVFPQAGRFDNHTNFVARLGGGHGLHGCTEISNVQTSPQTLGKRCFQELHHQGFPLLTDVDTDFVIGQSHHNSTRIVGSAAKIDVFQGQCFAVAAF